MLKSSARRRFTHLAVARTGVSGPAVVSVGFPDALGSLSNGLSRNVPLYWLRCDGFYVPSPVLRPIPEMAAAFAQELAAFAPNVPLLLVGYSFGGLLAAHLTHLLLQKGRSVGLMMIESPLPGVLPTAAKVRRRAWAAPAATKPTTSQPISRATETSGERFRRHWEIARLLTGSDRRHYLLLRLIGLLEYLPRLPAVGKEWHRRWLAYSERSRPHLESRLARGRDLPFWCRQWWYFMPHMFRCVRNHDLPCLPGPVYLAGRPSWLDLYTASWSFFVEDRRLHRCDMPDAGNHAQVVALRASRPWIEVVRQWVSDMGTHRVPGH